MVAATSPSVVLSAVFHQICLCLWLHYCHSAEKVNRATWGTWIKNKKEEKTIAATQKNLNRTEPNSNSFLTTKYRFSLQKIYSVAWHYDATSRLLLLWLVVANDKLSVRGDERNTQRQQALFAQPYIYKKYCQSQLKLRGRFFQVTLLTICHVNQSKMKHW